MKKRVLVLFFLIALVLSTSAFAISARARTINPSISFNGTTATCSVTAVVNPDENISVEMKLWDGSECINTWNANGTAFLKVSKTATVTRGHSYTLTVDAVIGGVTQPRVSTSGTCR